jgi:hypothetical protein
MRELDPARPERLDRIAVGLNRPEPPGAPPPRRWRTFPAAIAAVLVALGLLVPIVLLSPLGSDGSPGFVGDSGWYDAGTLNDLRARRIEYFPEIETFVIAPAGEDPYALAAESPHLGERLLLCRTSGWFFSPAHGEKFDLRGNYELGPADAGMTGRPVRIVDGAIQVDATKTIAGPARAAESTAALPNGPFCEEGSRGFDEEEPGFARPAGDLSESASFPVTLTEGIRPGDTVQNPGEVGGTAEFQADAIVVRLLGSDGSIMDEHKLACDTGSCPGFFSAPLVFDVRAPQVGTVLIGTPDVGTHRTIWLQQLPVTLEPASGVEPGSVFGAWYDGQGNPTYYHDEEGWHLTLHVIQGAEHCGWQSASFLTLAWPLGSDVQQMGDGDARQYVRDPNDAVGGDFDVPPPDLHAGLPADARSTGYQRGDWQLWVSDTDVDEAVYLVAADGTVERWPRAPTIAACA